MDSSQDRPSCIPRLSRLPRPTVTIPKPSSTTTPVASPSLRLTPSRDSLSGRITPALPSPSFRSSVSRNSVHSCSGHSSPHEVKPFVRHCASREQLRPGAKAVTPKTAAPRSTQSASASRRWSTITHNPTSQYRPWAEPRPGDPDRDDYLRESTPIDDAPKLLLTSYLNGTLGHSRMSDTSEPPSASSDSVFSDLSDMRSKRTGASLSERTMETLSQIPSSPEGSRKSFDDSRRGSMADGTASSRPSSSYNSEPSSGLMSPAVSKSQIPIGRASFASTRLPFATSYVPDAPSPAPVKRPCGAFHGRTCSRSMTSHKSTKPKINRLVRNLSISTLDTTSGSEMCGPPSAGWDGIARSTLPHLAEDTDEPGFRKSSSALRDHIAKAKAARRAAMQNVGGDEVSSVGYETTAAQSTATGFDESVCEDPFGLNKGGNKVLKQRVSAARTSGRLNIAAMALKEIPSEVMKMYDFESIQESGGTWADSVDLKRFIAADNELEKLDDAVFPDRDLESFDEDADDGATGNIFAIVESIDLHGNQLVSVPVGLRRLSHLTSLNLSSNRLNNECLGVITQIASLRDLKLAKNSFAGPLEASLANLSLLETLDIHGNHVSSLPSEVQGLTRLRILNLSENNFESIAFDSLAKLPLTELDLKRNKLSGTLIEDPIESLPHLQTFDISSNRLTRIVPEGTSISLPVVHTLLLSMNRLQELPDMSSWTNLLTLTADTNNITVIPDSFSCLTKLRQADFSGNDIKVIPPEIARMGDLTMLRLGGNPLREKKFSSASAEAIKAILAARLEPLQASQEVRDDAPSADGLDTTVVNESAKSAEECKSDGEESFSTAPTSGDDSSSELTWQVKSGGVLDQSRSALAILDSEICIKVTAQHKVHHLHLHHNLLTCMPGALSSFAVTLTSLALGHNKMEGETYLMKELTLPSLSELNLESNQITSLGPLTKFLRAPSLEKIDVSMNRLNALPLNLKDNFPKMIALLAANNHLTELDPVSIKGLRVVDVSNNEIAHLDPRISLLGAQHGLQKLEVMGNRFRAPRWDVLERGTEATLGWLRGRVSAADLAAWKAEYGGDGDDEDDLD